MAYKRLRSFIKGLHRSQDHWRIVLEDLEPKGGRLSRHWEIWGYLGIIKASSDGLEGIVLPKGGDVGGRGGSGKMVMVYCRKIWKWAEVLRRGMMWGGCVDKELGW